MVGLQSATIQNNTILYLVCLMLLSSRHHSILTSPSTSLG